MMVLLPEEAEMTLAELRQMAARQQHQIEAQQQLLVAKEQRLKFLKQQEARHHSLSEHQLDNAFVQDLRDKVNTQEIKLRQLKALRGQVEQQKTNNGNLGAELDSIRALFSEKEKELNLAVNKVEELSRQLDEIKLNKNRKKSVLTTTTELENLKRELLYRTNLSEQQNNYICQQREDIAHHQQTISLLDQKISDLSQRLNRKRLLNQQLASQIHTTNRNNLINLYHTSSIIAVEPLSREVSEPEHTQDDIATKLHGPNKGDLNEFSVTKNDPKYQTLPYNTKFTLKGKGEDTQSSSTEDDSCPNSLDSLPSKKITIPNSKPLSNTSSVSPKPFNGKIDGKNFELSDNKNESEYSYLENENLPPTASEQLSQTKQLGSAKSNTLSEPSNKCNILFEKSKVKHFLNQKPAVPPKPALPVKPIVLNRVNPANLIKDKIPNQKEVDTALNVLQKKSSINEKSIISNYRKRLLYYQCIPRYGIRDHTQQAPLSKCKTATYFKKTLQQDAKQGESIEHPGNVKRKSSLGQLPIKPKPLTIRKTPGLEPPKLKVQMSGNGSSIRRSVECNVSASHVKTTLNNQSNQAGEFDSMPSVPVIEVASPKKQDDEDKPNSYAAKPSENVFVECEESESKLNVDEVDLVNSLNSADVINETPLKEADAEEVFPITNVRRIRKGNLKGENSVRNSRRVSFDPLALLLDAALEGELELVKKTAAEVPNLSAANDEGITALHNAICAGHFDVVTFLVEFGCDVNAQDSDGWTPLHCAASCNNLPMVKFLVEKGACVFATTFSDHETAAEKCEEDEEGYDGCSEYLFNLQENLGVINNGLVYAVYDYEMQNADELGFKDGEVLIVLRKGDDKESEWWWSRLQDAEGYVPKNLLGLYPRVTSKKGQQHEESPE